MIDTEEQVAIYNEGEYGDGNMVIRARAGSGKTHALINLAKRLPQSKSITFVAFNRHIKEELKRKLPPNIYVYTSHGLGYSGIMRKYKDCEVDEFKVDKVMAKHMKSWDLSQVANIIEYMGVMKQMINLIRLTLTFDPNKVLDLAERYDLRFDLEDTRRAFLILEEMLNDKKTIDYTDQVYLPNVDKKIWLFPQDYVLVDEAQDLSKAQHELIKKLVKWDKATGKPITRLMFCGDDYQCQPRGTEILMGDGTKKLIEDLVEGDYVTTYDRKQRGWFVGYKKSPKYSFRVQKIESQNYNDNLIVIRSKDKVTKYTYNHKTFVRFRNDKIHKYGLYLMEKNGYYRIGIAPLWTKSERDSITARAKQENCDKFWLLNVYDTKFDAFKEEQFYSLKYRIPQLIFQYRKQKSNFKQSDIDEFYGRFDKDVLELSAKKILSHFNRRMEYPLWIKGSKNYLSKNHMFVIRACNIIGDYMQVIHFDEENKKRRSHGQKKKSVLIIAPKFENIDNLSYEYYNHKVFSLKIETHESYVADGVLTHNSIYGFTGADSNAFESLTRFPNTKVLPLTITFRCGKNIVAEANKIVTDIRPMENAIDGVVRSGSALDEAGDGDFILARKTLPLVRMFFSFLIMKKKATIKGSDFGINLIHMIEGEKTLAQLGASLANNLTKFREKIEKHGVFNIEEHTGYVMLKDKTDVITFLMKTVNSVDELKQMILGIFQDNVTDGIMLSTVHKAKGLEADRVFIIKPKDMPLKVSKGWMYQQEMNLKYIAITRAKKELIYDHEWSEDDPTPTTGATPTVKESIPSVTIGD
jgi:superfamily I DNA/RNA helicase